MRVLSNLTRPKKMGTLVSSEPLIHKAVNSRIVALQSASGYPVASYVVRRIQQGFDLSNIGSLLQSIVTLRNFSYAAAEILASIPLLRTDRYQLSRADLDSYISVNAASFGLSVLSPDDVSFISYLITASEANDNMWRLAMEDGPNNRIISLTNLYLTLTNAAAVDIQHPDRHDDAYKTYNPFTDSIVPLAESRRGGSLIRGYRRASTDEERTRHGELYNGLANVHLLFNVRLVDHVAALILSVDIWDRFISPRPVSTPALNAERVKSLRLLSGYCHSLLMMSHHLSLNMFFQSMERMSGWIGYSVPVPQHLQKAYDEITAKYDVLDCKGDVADLLSGLSHSDDSTLGTNIIGIPRDIISINTFAAIEHAVEAALSDIPEVKISNLHDLGNAAFNPLLMNYPVGALDLTATVTETILLSDEISQLLKEALATILPASTRYYPESVTKELVDLRPRVPFKFNIPFPLTPVALSATDQEYKDGAFRMSLYSPPHNFDIERTLRTDKAYSVFKASEVNALSHNPFIINKQVLNKLRGILGYDYSTLVPSWSISGARVVHRSDIVSDLKIEELITSLTGVHYELFKTSVSNNFVSMIYATFLSSFALLYKVVDTGVGSGTFDPSRYKLIEGYGKPYGTSYSGLEAMQETLSENNLLKLSDSVYMRFLTKLPLLSTALRLDTDFYLRNPYYYFEASDSTKYIEVKTWVIGEGLSNFCYAPILKYALPYGPLFDKKYAYLNDFLVIQVDLLFRYGNSIDNEYSVNVPMVTNNWSYDKLDPNLHYISFGNYSSANDASGITSNSSPESENALMTKLTSEMEKSIASIEKESTIGRQDEARTTLDVPQTKTLTGTVTTAKEGNGSTEQGKNKKNKKKRESNDKDDLDQDSSSVIRE